jgi:hypothetical protein
MKIFFIFVMLLSISCFQSNILKASCESALFLHGVDDSHFQSGHSCFMNMLEIICKNCGKRASFPSHRTNQIFCSAKCGHEYFVGEKHPNWVGSDIGRAGVHNWVYRHYGKASKCEMCQGSSAAGFEWASINHSYVRDISQWKQLCPKCHKIFDGFTLVVNQLDDDGNIIKKWETQREAADFIGTKKKYISQATKRKCKHKGYYWQYDKDFGNPYKDAPSEINSPISVVQIDNNGSIINEFRSITDAQVALHFSSRVNREILRVGKKINGYTLKLKNVV